MHQNSHQEASYDNKTQTVTGDWHPCSYMSKSFSKTKQNYEIYDRELLAIIQALTEWQHYLQGSQHPTTILSDHKNLTYFKTAQKLNRRQARWHLTLSKYDIKLIHVPGKQMVQSNALSWQPNLCPDEDTDNEDKVLLPDTMFVRLIDTELRDLITNNEQHDTVILKAIWALQGGKQLPMNSKIDDWTFENGLIFYKDKCYVPNDLDLQWKILEKYHDAIPIGHPGQLRTQEIVQRLLVAWSSHFRQKLHWWMCHMPATQNQSTPAEPTPTAS